MKRKYTFSQRFKYKFDSILSKGTSSIILFLGFGSGLIILIFGSIYSLSGIMKNESGDVSFAESLWQSLMRSLDAGTVAGDSGWGLRFLGLLITIGGIFILSSLIGILTSGLGEKLDSLRKGRSLVIESNHTLILGWSSKIYSIIKELIIANESKKNSVIVVMSDIEKTQMEDEIREYISETKTTKIICRTGSPIDLKDLSIVNPDEAKSIIVLSNEEENADIFVIKSILALTHNPNRKEEKYHIVAEIKEKENLLAAEIAGNDEALFVFTQELTARIAAQTSRQSGLSVVYTQLLSFDGDEIYYQKEDLLAGKTYYDAQTAYNNSTVIGVIDFKEKVKLNPSKETIIGENDRIIAISEDDNTIILSGKIEYNINDSAVNKKIVFHEKKLERNLILGWNAKGYMLAKELDNYMSKGSLLHIVSEKTNPEEIKEILQEGIVNQEIKIDMCKFYHREELIKLDVMSYDNIIVLSLEHYEPQESDGKTIITLLHLRSLAENAGKKLNIVSEMNIQKNRELAEVTKADDFIISEDIISGILSQLSESKVLKNVFDELFDSEGVEIYLKDYTNYLLENSEVNFYTILKSASDKGHTAIGYRKHKLSNSHTNQYGVFINPDKDLNIKFEQGDRIIVIADE